MYKRQEKPFQGETVTDALAAVVTAEPDWQRLPETTPPAVRSLLRRCLQKAPARRLQTIADARIEIEDAAGEPPGSYQETPVSGASGSRKSISLRAAIAWALGAALIGGGLTAAIVEQNERKQTAVPRNPQPVIFLMDTPAPHGVYDPETLMNSGTNADNLNDILRDLPVVLHKENLGANWDRDDQILNQRPDLILIHRSAFFHSANAELGLGYPPFDDPEDEILQGRAYQLIENKLIAFLGYVALGDPQTRFLVYSRGKNGIWPEEEQAAWVADVEQRFPQLKGRLFVMKVPVGPDGGSFRVPATAQMLRQRVVELLGLEASGGDRT